MVDGIYLANRQYIKAYNKYINDYDKNKVSSNFKHWDMKNLHRPAMLQNLPAGGFKWVKINKWV